MNEKKLLENSIFSGIAVPIAIVLVGALVVFGVTKMLSSERTYKDLVQEMRSKTFGNRWVAAYELSKVLSSAQIPDEEIPALILELEQIYKETNDPRTQEFIVAAVGTRQVPMALPLLTLALSHQNPNVVFHSVVALGNFPLEKFPEAVSQFPKETLLKLLGSEDKVLKQAVVLALAQHRFPEAQEPLRQVLSDSGVGPRYAAATGLIAYKDSEALPVLKEILQLQSAPGAAFNEVQVQDLQLNVIGAYAKWPWPALDESMQQIAQNGPGERVRVRAREVLNQLKL